LAGHRGDSARVEVIAAKWIEEAAAISGALYEATSNTERLKWPAVLARRVVSS
jgi:hypothetical protein